ncbi:MAG: hypothetical protein AAFQ41_17020 [Cyanobacteria bacterium J06623_7]
MEMKSEANEQKAIEILDGAEWMGRDIKVDKAKPRPGRVNERKTYAGYWLNTF